MATLRDAFRAFPDSATVWETNKVADSGGAGTTYDLPATVLYLRAYPDATDANLPAIPPLPENFNQAKDKYNTPPTSFDAAPFDDSARQVFILPLVSGAKPRLLAPRDAAISPINITEVRSLSLNDAKLARQNFVNVNFRRTSTDTQGWIGTSPATLQLPIQPIQNFLPCQISRSLCRGLKSKMLIAERLPDMHFGSKTKALKRTSTTPAWEPPPHHTNGATIPAPRRRRWVQRPRFARPTQAPWGR